MPLYEVDLRDIAGNLRRVTEDPVDMADAYLIIEQTHNEGAEAFAKILDAWCLRGLHETIRERMNNGEEYIITSALTGEIVRRVHANF